MVLRHRAGRLLLLAALVIIARSQENDLFQCPEGLSHPNIYGRVFLTKKYFFFAR